MTQRFGSGFNNYLHIVATMPVTSRECHSFLPGLREIRRELAGRKDVYSLGANLGPFQAPRLKRVMARAVSLLAKTQRDDGSWVPAWFGNQHAPNDTNPTYGTARVVSRFAATGRPHVSL
jgi:hypothetical protein